MHEEELHQVGVDADESLRCVRDDGGEADDECDDSDGEQALTGPHENQRRDGDDGDCLQKNRVREEHAPEPGQTRENERDQQAADDASRRPSGCRFARRSRNEAHSSGRRVAMARATFSGGGNI